mmetsp:Transcript_849/g.2259  ORF Transcript_849/g.2259 Transcript_849/m.2259 type:complete len:328 (+) Transcript_849:30-1013(+)|eukprot:CAMPEP_0173421754 /NCGR_PEP_ID=MMETSP1357-20121228/2742_1 /TAXON_ID=77926 /ORGANISM="Hemiselmis rufescens, Strain PCC563" /LENGTH=327 /DNA_ID=CAMNT_0014384701 /DNA_START=27 /DNA_END=1010 /DNA_ORIENTATION=+
MFCPTALSSDDGGYAPWTPNNQGGWSHSWYITKGRRPAQEDTLDIIHQNGVHIFAVFDGHNGWMCSKRLKASFCKDLMAKVAPLNLGNKAQVEQVIRQEIRTFEARFKEEMVKVGNRPDGSTLNVCILKGMSLTCVNIGDSRAVLVQQCQQAVKMSDDHKPTNPSEAQRVERAGGYIERNANKAWRVNGIISVSRSVGDFNIKKAKPGLICEPDFKHMTLTQKDEYLVIATDGLWDGLSVEDVAFYATQKAGPGAARGLVSSALARGSTDNTACIVVDVRGAFTSAPPPQGPGAASQACAGFGRFLTECLGGGPPKNYGDYSVKGQV